MIVLSLFDGIACGRLACQRAGLPVDRYYASEIDKYAMRVARQNHSDVIQCGDVKNIAATDFFKPVDLLMAGSPCQGFSYAGTHLNFHDERSALFFEFVRLKNELNPEWWLLENVVMKHEWQDIISDYVGADPFEINSAYFSAQHRKRLYWTNIPIAPYATKENYNRHKLPDILLSLEDEPWDGKDWTFNEKNLYGELRLSDKELAYMNRKVKDGRTHWDFKHFSKWHNEKSACVVANWRKGVPYNVLIDIDYVRKFHPIEAERLQTLPDNYTKGLSRTRRYEVIGNGWTVDVIAHILRGISI